MTGAPALAGRSRPARGFTLIEVMISGVVLIVAMIGFIAMIQHVMSSNALAHRRTLGAFVRGSLLDELAVTSRRVIGTLPQNAWVIDECYDQNSQPNGTNTLRAADYECPPTAHYRRWMRIAPIAGATNAYSLGVYVERIDAGCIPAMREASSGCVSADLLVND